MTQTHTLNDGTATRMGRRHSFATNMGGHKRTRHNLQFKHLVKKRTNIDTLTKNLKLPSRFEQTSSRIALCVTSPFTCQLAEKTQRRYRHKHRVRKS